MCEEAADEEEAGEMGESAMGLRVRVSPIRSPSLDNGTHLTLYTVRPFSSTLICTTLSVSPPSRACSA